MHKPVIKIQCLNLFSKRQVVAWDGQVLTILRWVHLKAFSNPPQQPDPSVVFQPNGIHSSSPLPRLLCQRVFLCVPQRNVFPMHTQKLFLNTLFSKLESLLYMVFLEFCGTIAGLGHLPLQKNIQESRLNIIFSGIFLFSCLLACF